MKFKPKLLEESNMTVDEARRIFANPFYCIEIHPDIADAHKPIITESQWIKAAQKEIEEVGVKIFLKNLLENLKGNYVAHEDGSVAGYTKNLQ